MEFKYGLKITYFASDEVAATNSDKERFEAHWDDDTHAWSVTAWGWDMERNEYHAHQYMGEYYNLVEVMMAMDEGIHSFYELNEVNGND